MILRMLSRAPFVRTACKNFLLVAIVRLGLSVQTLREFLRKLRWPRRIRYGHTPLSITLIVALSACGPLRSPVPPGEIPYQTSVAPADEQFGQEVFGLLSESYPISQDDAPILRVRAIVDKLTQGHGNAQNPWHVYILQGDGILNAAATRGNYIFIWTGMLQAVKSDDELATVLSHEVAHVLAGHTMPTPEEETRKILSESFGKVAQEVLYQQGGVVGALAGLGGALVGATFEAFLLNPEKQRQELEADHIGLFLMARAGYDPNAAIELWTRLKSDPDFNLGGPLSFLSTHPASTGRLQQLKELLPRALALYRGENTKAEGPGTGELLSERDRWLAPQ